MTLLRVDGLSAGYGGPPVIHDVTFEIAAGERVGVLGPNGGGKSTLFRVLLGELAPSGGTISGTRRFGYVPQTERSRLDYPVTALDVALMGTLTSSRWWLPVGKRDRERGARGARARRPCASRRTRCSASSRAGSASASSRRARSCRTRRCCCSTSRSAASTSRAPSCSTSLLDELAAEGRGLLIATHDLEQAAGWDRVLCLNRRARSRSAFRRTC